MAPTEDEVLAKVQESLSRGEYACTSLTKLSGGTANYVYRGVLTVPLEDGAKNIVIKHTPPYVASNPGFSLTADRCRAEYAILRQVQESHGDVKLGAVTVATPKLYRFDESANTQVYADVPESVDLKNFVLKHGEGLTKEQCERLGKALGLWAKSFHTWANSPQQSALRETMKMNESMKKLKFFINYGGFLDTGIASFPDIFEGTEKVYEEIKAKFAKAEQEEEGLLIHGDFWTGNILLHDTPLSDQALPVYVIDWELSHLSKVSFDLGQMFAELFQLTHFKKIEAGVWLIESFMDGYGKIDEDLAFETVVHVGTHFICFGSRTAGWGTEEQVRRLVEIGRDFMVKGWARDREFFEGTALKCLFR